MADSAIKDDGGLGLRERKRLATRAAISDTARTLAARYGFSNFTVEQLCQEVGISRRTFFNYFPSKEDALIGHHEDGIPADLVAEFVRKGAGSPPGTLSAGLIADFVELACGWEALAPFSREDYLRLVEAIDKDPKLLALLIGTSEKRERLFIELVAAREGLEVDDPRAVAATLFMSAVTQRTLRDFLKPGNTRTYREILTGYVAAAGELFNAQHRPTGPSDQGTL